MKIYILCDNDRLVKAYMRRIVAENKAEDRQLESDKNSPHSGQHYWHVHDIELEEE